ncbi:hypothetical protein [Spongiactinospora sp. 9N601]|uniref:hypothetical protein n=1 Tax=Spongiactinospora sp. 9N601 TaxID=3375149 RepID=UPI0037A926DD
MSRARRAELQRRAREIRLEARRRGLGVDDIAEAIVAALPDLLPLEAWRLACGWSRPVALQALAALYQADGLSAPPVNSAMLCRWEHGTVAVSAGYAAALCRLYQVPPKRLGLPHEGSATTTRGYPLRRPPAVTVGGHDDRQGADPMRRRTLLAAGVSIPAAVLERVDDMLALPPRLGPRRALPQIQDRLAHARRQFDTSALGDLVAALPGLLTAARDTAEQSNTPGGWAMLAACYNLATDTLNKVGRKKSARITADRGVLYAERSSDPVAMASSARALGMMLRTGGRHQTGIGVFQQAIDRLDATGLRTRAQASVLMRLQCASAYTAAWAGDRDGALEGIRHAEHAADRVGRLAARPGTARPFTSLYRVNIHHVLGDTGSALHAASSVRT